MGKDRRPIRPISSVGRPVTDVSPNIAPVVIFVLESSHKVSTGHLTGSIIHCSAQRTRKITLFSHGSTRPPRRSRCMGRRSPTANASVACRESSELVGDRFSPPTEQAPELGDTRSRHDANYGPPPCAITVAAAGGWRPTRPNPSASSPSSCSLWLCSTDPNTVGLRIASR